MAVALGAGAAAAAKQPYQPVGAPSDPKVAAHWNRYHDHAEATALLKALAEAYPGLAKLESLGQSYGGRGMWVITITNFESGPEAGKGAFWIDGGIHANEIQGPEVALYTAWYLLEMYGRSEFITRLLDERVFYILPMLSPDSRDAHFYEPNSSSSPRSGQRPVDDDRDGLVDEDPPDDLDGDGHITQMRIRDPNGRYKQHPDYPNVLIRAEQNEPGEYTLLGREGYDNDGDGRINEDGDGYYDPNRDWGWNWQPRYIQWGAYRYPFSIMENRMAADFVMAHPNIAGAQSYHNSGGMFLRGPGDKQDSFERGDVRLFDAIGKQGEEMIPGYDYLVVWKDLYQVHGGELDWLYMMNGALTFSNELFTSYNLFHSTRADGWIGSREEQAKFDKYLLFGEGAVEWKEVEHPQYGTVEVGGRKKTWGRQPPSFMLEEECHRNMAFTLYHADQMPKVEVQSASAKPLGRGLTEVTAVIANPRMIPTHLEVDLKNKITRTDWVIIEGEGIEVVAGYLADGRFFANAVEQKRNPERMEIPNIDGMGAVYVRWLVRGGGGDGEMTVTVSSVKGGVHSLVVE